MRFDRRFLLALAMLASENAARAGAPNVVLIFADDLGYADVGCFGAKGYETPNVDRLAREGRKFTNFHVSQAVCSASRAALLTGRYSNRFGIHGALGPGATHGLPAEETTIAEMFKSRGYATGMAGKWHLGHRPEFLPTRHGFDEYLGLPYSNDMWPHHPEARPGTYPPLPLYQDEVIVDPDVSPDDQKTLTRRYAERAASFIDQNKERPFFFYLAFSMPHVPLFVSEPFEGKTTRGLFVDVLAEIDWAVGEVLAALDRNGLARDTVVIFTSDNGPWLSYGDHAGSAGPFREGKGTSWEGGVRVPCVIRWPGRLAEATSSDAFLMTTDLLPTLGGLIGAGPPALPADGKDVWPVMSGAPGATNPHEAYLFFYERNQLQAVASGDGRWKLQLPHSYRTLNGRPGGVGGVPVKYDQAVVDRPELYDLAADPSEASDVAGANPEVVRRLLRIAEKAREEFGAS